MQNTVKPQDHVTLAIILKPDQAYVICRGPFLIVKWYIVLQGQEHMTRLLASVPGEDGHPTEVKSSLKGLRDVETFALLECENDLLNSL